jgi:hypothetical protein
MCNPSCLISITHCRWSDASPVPYTDTLAYQSWAPYNFIDGYYNDAKTTGTTNKRALLVSDDGEEVLDVLLPQSCLQQTCAMQVRSELTYAVEEATLKYRCVLHLKTQTQTNQIKKNVF